MMDLKIKVSIKLKNLSILLEVWTKVVKTKTFNCSKLLFVRGCCYSWSLTKLLPLSFFRHTIILSLLCECESVLTLLKHFFLLKLPLCALKRLQVFVDLTYKIIKESVAPFSQVKWCVYLLAAHLYLSSQQIATCSQIDFLSGGERFLSVISSWSVWFNDSNVSSDVLVISEQSVMRWGIINLFCTID